MLKWLLALVAIGACWHFWNAPHAKPPRGIVTPNDPIITMVTEFAPWHTTRDGYTITELAKFEMHARVLHTQSYWFGREADLAPVDFAMGWGKMSDQNLLDLIDIDQGERFYFWSYHRQLPVPTDYIIRHTTNMHMIPATDAIKSKLKSVRENDIIDVQGYLVTVNAPDGYHWRSSTSLSDTGRGACKLVWVQSLTIH